MLLFTDYILTVQVDKLASPMKISPLPSSAISICQLTLLQVIVVESLPTPHHVGVCVLLAAYSQCLYRQCRHRSSRQQACGRVRNMMYCMCCLCLYLRLLLSYSMYYNSTIPELK